MTTTTSGTTTTTTTTIWTEHPPDLHPQKEWDKRNNEAMTSLYLCMTDAEASPQLKTMIEIQNYAAQLRSMGAVIDDEMEVARIISSMMDEKFRQFREAWRSVEIAKQTSALLLSRLKTWELEDGETYKNASHVEETSKAYAAKKERPKRTRQEISDLKKKTKCHICKLKGHWKSECTFKDKDSAKKEQKSDEKSEGAYMAGGLSDLWINDSGANRHYCGRKDWFFEYKEYPCPKSVSMADNSLMLVKGVGAVKVKALINKVWRDIEAERRDGLQIMKFKPIVNRAMACIKPVVWHERLAHINSKFLNDTKDKEAAYGLENMKREDVNFKCEICMKAKSKKKSYVTVEKTVTDEASAFRQVYFQKKKGETAMNVIDAINFMRTQTGNNVKMFRSDNGGEYKCQELVSFFSKRGIRFGLNSPQCSPSNGFVEREMRIEQDAARSMLIQSQLHESHWEDAIRTACYVLNRTLSTKNTEKTPYEQVIGKKPTLQHVRIFGSKAAFAHITNGQGKKFDDKATECILVGFDAHTKNYILNDETEQTNGASETEGEEAETYSSASNSPQQTNPKVHQHNETWADEIQWEASQEDRNFVNTSLPPQPSSSKPKRERQQRKFYQAGSGDANVAMHATNTEPTTYSAALSSKYAGEWKEAMDSEMRSHSENGTWRLVKRPVGKKVLKNRWVYKIKHNPNSEIEKFKARLVVKGFNQVKAVDYTETFAPVSRYETIRTLLSVAAARKLKLVQFDIGTAYLNSELKEEVYMEEAEGYEIGSDMVYILDKTLYGLPQSGRAWFETFSAKLKEMGYVQSKSDKCLFMKTASTGKIYVLIYVDDGLFAGKNKKELLAEIEKLKASFKVTIQPLVRFLGIEILQVEEGIFLHQTKYIEDLLERFGMQDCITLPIPMQPGLQFDGSECDPNLEFQQLIGSLLFLVRCTRPDIAYATHYLSRFFGSYNKLHMNAAKRILQYLKGTKSLGIMYTESEADRDVVCAYVDADYGSDTTSRKSTSGVLFTHNNSPIVWMSKRQTCISLSSCQAEYVALALAGKEAVWVTRLYLELDMISLENEPICLKTDSQSAIKLAKNDEFHDKSKHIDIRHHFIRDLVETNQVVLEHLPDKVQPADILTKSVVRESFETKRYLMGMVPSSSCKGREEKSTVQCYCQPKATQFIVEFYGFIALIFNYWSNRFTQRGKSCFVEKEL
ncbi:Copia protein [Folsomia candida]|uniref:Copia protein n=1 Tax=Folsomia candida TaxID=158441 RepID=A0A226DD03_FOLCA|nr:Copia protein [Folsomia candida]